MNQKALSNSLGELDLRQIIIWFVAELLGTMILSATVLSVGAVAYGNPIYPPFVIGIAIMVAVYLFSPASGGHFNPAVTIALCAIKKVKVFQAIIYIAAQITGAFFGLILVRQLIADFSLSAPSVTTTAATWGEFIGTFILVFAVAAIVLKKIPEQLNGFVVGAALTIGLAISTNTGAGILNPALALSFGTLKLTYLFVPILGGLVAAAIASLLYSGSPEK